MSAPRKLKRTSSAGENRLKGVDDDWCHDGNVKLACSATGWLLDDQNLHVDLGSCPASLGKALDG